MAFAFSFKEILDQTNDIVIVTDAETDAPGPRIVYVNAAFEHVTGYRREEVLGHSPRFLQGPKTARKARAALRRALRRQEPVRTQIVNYTKHGESYWLDIRIIPLRSSETGRVTHFAAIERDITEYKAMEQQLRALATTDSLTGTANRYAFFRAAETEVARALRYNTPLSLIVFDVDHFKTINDRFGHAAGDQALKHLVAVAGAVVRRADLLARIGGEEFVVLLRDTPLDRAHHAAERLRAAIAASPAATDSGALPMTVSCGVAALDPQRDSKIDGVLARADAALYTAKTRGRNRIAHGAG